MTGEVAGKQQKVALAPVCKSVFLCWFILRTSSHFSLQVPVSQRLPRPGCLFSDNVGTIQECQCQTMTLKPSQPGDTFPRGQTGGKSGAHPPSHPGSHAQIEALQDVLAVSRPVALQCPLPKPLPQPCRTAPKGCATLPSPRVALLG